MNMCMRIKLIFNAVPPFPCCFNVFLSNESIEKHVYTQCNGLRLIRILNRQQNVATHSYCYWPTQINHCLCCFCAMRHRLYMWVKNWAICANGCNQYDAGAKLCYIEIESRLPRSHCWLSHKSSYRHLYLATILYRTLFRCSTPAIFSLLILSSNSFVIYFYFPIFLPFMCGWLFGHLKTNILSHCFEYQQQQQQQQNTETAVGAVTTPSNRKSVRAS